METMEQLQECVVAGHEMAYRRQGRGEPVVLLHGITTYSFIWRRLVPLLGDSYDLIMPDLLGCGDSAMPFNTDYSIKTHARLIREFVDQLGLDRFHLVGHDVGGGVAQVYAVNNPETLASLTLINTVAYDFWPVQPIIAMRTPILRQMAMATLDLGAFRIIVRRGIHRKDRVTDELMSLFWYPMKRDRGRKAFLHFARSLNNEHLLEISDQLRNLEVPTLVVRGDADPYLCAEIAEKLQREIPGARLERIADGSHFIQEDQPERLAEVIGAHLRDHLMGLDS